MKAHLFVFLATCLLCSALSFSNQLHLSEDPIQDGDGLNDAEPVIETTQAASLVFGRLELYNSDSLVPRCMKADFNYNPEKNQWPVLVQSRCSYRKRAMFSYDPETGALRPLKFPHLQLTTDASTREKNEASYTLKFMTQEEIETRQQENDATAANVTLVPREFSVLSLSNPNANNNGFCLRVVGASRGLKTAAIPIGDGGEMSACSQVRWVPIHDDFSEGILRMKKDNKYYCATYRPGVKPPVSAMTLALCDGSKYQNMLFNDVNGQLRVKLQDQLTGDDISENPLIFMWWSGALKPYPDVPVANENNYGWSIAPVNTYGPITSLDNRGYSGYCWMVDSQSHDIVANQTCSMFKFIPKVLSPTQNIREKMRKYSNAAVMLQVVQPNGELGCLRIRRVYRKLQHHEGAAENANNLGSIVIFRLAVGECDATSALQRFILVTQDKGCLKSAGNECQAHLRWVGDPSNTLVWIEGSKKSALGLTRDGYAVVPAPNVEQDLPGQWNLKIRDFGPVTATDREGCWTWTDPSKKLIKVKFGVDDCIQTKIVPVQDLYDIPKDLVLVEEYRASTTIYMNKQKKKLSEGDTLNKRNQNTISRFFSDFGFFGLRRLERPSGKNYDLRGFVLEQSAYLSFPFVPNPYLTNSPYGLISVRFQSFKVAKIGHFRGQGMLLFSFRANHGCSVYATGRGGMGLRCRTEEGERHCQFRFKDGFKLNDGQFHTVSLLYSTQPSGAHILYVDMVEIGQCAFQATMQMTEVSTRLYVFKHPVDWGYRGFAGRVTRVSVLSGGVESLQQVAAGQVSVYPNTDRLNDDTLQIDYSNTKLDSLGFQNAVKDDDDVPQTTKLSKTKPSRLETKTSVTRLSHSDSLGLQSQVHHTRRLLSVTTDHSASVAAASTSMQLAKHRHLKLQDPKAKKKQEKELMQQEQDRMRRTDKQLEQQGQHSSDDDVAVVEELPQISADKVADMTTEWTNCEPLYRERQDGTTIQYALRCQFDAQLNQDNMELIPDMFTVGCSRPGCHVRLNKEGDQLYLEYQPHYPAQFKSENVGNPGLFSDVATITDGYTTAKVSFGIKYQPQDIEPKKPVQRALSNPQEAELQSELEVSAGMLDVQSYKMAQSCCATLLQKIFDVQEDVF